MLSTTNLSFSCYCHKSIHILICFLKHFFLNYENDGFDEIVTIPFQGFGTSELVAESGGLGIRSTFLSLAPSGAVLCAA